MHRGSGPKHARRWKRQAWRSRRSDSTSRFVASSERSACLIPCCASSRTWTQTGVTQNPYETLAPATVARDGFSVRRDTSRYYYAPDADILLSDAFVGGHCFGTRRGGPAGSVGLTFRPQQTRLARRHQRCVVARLRHGRTSRGRIHVHRARRTERWRRRRIVRSVSVGSLGCAALDDSLSGDARDRVPPTARWRGGAPRGHRCRCPAGSGRRGRRRWNWWRHDINSNAPSRYCLRLEQCSRRLLVQW